MQYSYRCIKGLLKVFKHLSDYIYISLFSKLIADKRVVTVCIYMIDATIFALYKYKFAISCIHLLKNWQGKCQEVEY